VVAIKVLSPYVAADPKFRGRFDREVNLLRRLEHPNIVPILAFGQADGFHYIVMPYVSSGTLHERLRAGPLLPLEGGRIVEQIASALDFAHQQGVIHRDIKPSNILIDENGKALLTDFGFAHVPWESASLTGSLLIGTPAYMSPEQCRGEDVGEHTQDVFGRAPCPGDRVPRARVELRERHGVVERCRIEAESLERVVEARPGRAFRGVVEVVHGADRSDSRGSAYLMLEAQPATRERRLGRACAYVRVRARRRRSVRSSRGRCRPRRATRVEMWAALWRRFARWSRGR
jgi:hypothetical protein